MSAPAPERPGAPVDPPGAHVGTLGALVLAHVVYRESLLERTLAIVLQALWMFRLGVTDEPEAFAEASEAIRSSRNELRDATTAYTQEIFAQYGEDYPAFEEAEDQFAVDEEFWRGLTNKFDRAMDEAADERVDEPTREALDLFRDRTTVEPAPQREWSLPDEIVIDPDLDDPDLQALFDETVADLEQYLAEVAEEAEAEARAGDSSKVIGYRRVPHPELSKGGTCGLCVLAATRRYTRPNLKPLHGGCHCEVLPITEDHDPADDLNMADGLWAAYQEMNTTDGWAAKQYRFKGTPGDLEMVQGRKKWGAVKPRSDRKERDPRNSAAEGLSDMSDAQLYDFIGVYKARVDGLVNGKDRKWARRRLAAAYKELDRRGLPLRRT